MKNSTEFDTVDVDWLGHASVKLEDSDNFTVYVDLWNDVMGEENDEADVVVSTHDHFDHFDKKAIQSIKKRDTVLILTEDSEGDAPEEVQKKIIKPGTSIKARDQRFKGVHAYNLDKFREPDTPYHPKGLSTGVIFELDDLSFYHMSDTDPIPELEDIDEDIDVAFVPVGGKYTMDQEEAIEAINMFNPEKVVPIHYGYVDGTTADVEKLEEDIREKTEAEPVILESNI